MFSTRRNKGKISRLQNLLPDIFRGSPTAAAQHLNAEFRYFFHLQCKIPCREVIGGFPVLYMGKTRIGIDNDGNRTNGSELFYNRIQLLRSQTAVDAKRVYPQPFQHRRHCGYRASGEELAFFIKNDGDQNRKIGIFFGGQNGSLGFHGIRHGFDQHQIRPFFPSPADELRKDGDTVFKVQIAHGL